MLLRSHPDWHWLKPSTLELVRIPKGVKAAELEEPLYKASMKEPQALENLAKSEEVYKEKKAAQDEKISAHELILAQLRDEYGEGDKSLGAWNSSMNMKKWDKKDAKDLKKAVTSLATARKACEKSVDTVSKRQDELQEARKYDKVIPLKVRECEGAKRPFITSPLSALTLFLTPSTPSIQLSLRLASLVAA